MYDDFKVANYSKALLSPELFGRHLSRLFTGDVIDGLTVSPGTGLQVALAAGNAFIRFGSANVASSRFVSLVNSFNLAIGTPDASNPRIDLVVVYVDNSVSLPDGTPTSDNLDGKGVAKAKIVPGTAAATPSAPNATAIQASIGSGNPYTVVAQVRVEPGVSVISAAKITDVRSMVKLSGSRLAFDTFKNSPGWDSGRVELPLRSGFTGPVYLRRIGSMVYVSGQVNKSSGSFANGDIFADIPEGFWPAANAFYSCPMTATNTTKVEVNTDKILRANTVGGGSAGYIVLDTIAYQAD